ncbi:MAG TPA: CDP-glucose 4,6-dehydratase [Vicinamibacterales bacterium]|jgi:CDP-glucose 4,6-dehydratase|nr:CDP-glucose 4,6-dehydratase [Vicinamibacterales bacterium]
MPIDPAFWRGRRILLTGHTGFKGAWMAAMLAHLGARVTGFALAPDTDPNLFTLAHIAEIVPEGFGDLRDPQAVAAAVRKADPEVVLHLAAQALVRRAVREPVATCATNVMGTAHLLDALRTVERLRAVLVVTSDKVYENPQRGVPFREGDPLGGHDPYAASKAAAEIVAASFARTYFDARGIAVATARGGNVIGGGDFAADRIVPDIFRAMAAGHELVLRHPDATRPWQHVLDCVAGYLVYAQALAQGRDVPRALNFGPTGGPPISVAALATAMQQALGARQGWRVGASNDAPEMATLALDSTLARNSLGWSDRLIGDGAVRATADWYLALARGDDMAAFTRRSIEDYLG